MGARVKNWPSRYLPLTLDPPPYLLSPEPSLSQPYAPNLWSLSYSTRALLSFRANKDPRRHYQIDIMYPCFNVTSTFSGFFRFFPVFFPSNFRKRAQRPTGPSRRPDDNSAFLRFGTSNCCCVRSSPICSKRHVRSWVEESTKPPALNPKTLIYMPISLDSEL